MITQLRTQIFDICKMVTQLGDRVYYLEAPQSCVRPYCVFSQVANTSSRDTATKFEDYYMQFNIYADSQSTVEQIAALLKTALDDSEAEFSFPGFNVVRIERELSRNQKIENVYQISIQYKFDLAQS